jgi:hypothetical protein
MKNGSNFAPFYHRHGDGRSMEPAPPRKPSHAEIIAERKDKFAAMNDWVTARGGWITSIPGEIEIRLECPVGSTLPDDLRGIGYVVEPDGEGERILHGSPA